MRRIWFAIIQGWKFRNSLKDFLVSKDKQLFSLEEITAARLDAANVAILILDFDGVMAFHGAEQPEQDVSKWLQRLAQEIGEQRIAIFTNNLFPNRLKFFEENFPSIYVVRRVAKKPYPEGITEIVNYKGVGPERALLVDDRLLTGMLATKLACCQGWYFRKPRQSFTHHPIKEIFFSSLRLIERALFYCIGGKTNQRN